MRVARVTVHAPVTSFRHPFFVTGHQPTFLMPPPSTVFGHCASALGRWPEPEQFWFGIHFTFAGRGDDLEHQHVTEAVVERTRTKVPTPEGDRPAVVQVMVQPVRRDFLFDTTMTLYLDPCFAPAFRAPVFPVVLGRSQDLAEVRAVEEVVLEKPARARVEHTLLPAELRPCVRFGNTVLLSRYIGPAPERETTFARYIVLHEPVFFGEEPASTRSFDHVEGVALDDLWCDPTVVDDEGFPRGVWIHRIVERPAT